ncbi:epoxide hydrolase 3-like [Ochlerotatus camptorhynchus]|uniref:epoxide hydrolase 3-like n=1 Tax=Ochlerotatus camptorhynchus TaxID=644619 RepID=UPI0031D6E2AD
MLTQPEQAYRVVKFIKYTYRIKVGSQSDRTSAARMQLLLRLLQAIAIYSISAFYGIKFLLKTVFEFLFDPHLDRWATKDRSISLAVLHDPAFGRHKYVEVNGIQLHYVENGDPEKPLMLFLHGFPEFWFSWRHQMKEFSRDYRVVALDLRGYGGSEAPNKRSAYQLDLLVEDVRSFVKALGYEKVILVGHDWGAIIGFQFVLKHMAMIDRYIMMGAPSLDVTRRLLATSWQQFRMSWYAFFFMLPRLPEFYIWSKDFRYIDQNMGAYLTKLELEAYKYTFSSARALTRAIDYYRENFSFLQKEEKLPVIERYCPGLYLMAEHDQFISMHSGQLLMKSIPHLRCRVIPASGHYIQQEDPQLVNKMIRDFLDL